MQKVILVTGASSGLGKEIIEILSKDYVVYAGIRNIGEVEEGENIRSVKLDITSDKDTKDAIEKIVKDEGRVDVLVNVAGYTLVGPSLDFTSDDFSKLLDVNTVGAFRLIKNAVLDMKKRKEGRIINITSLNGLISFPNFGLYSASKHGLDALGLALRYELAKDGIWVTNIAPGAILSDEKTSKALPHKPAREKFKFLYFLMPMVTRREVALKIRDLIESSNPPGEIIMGADAKITTFLKRVPPPFIWEYLMSYVWSKK